MTDNANFQPKALPFWQRTFSSLRYRDYRLVWLGSCTEHMGEQMEAMKDMEEVSKLQVEAWRKRNFPS